MTAVRVGCGWDIHPLVEGRKLILGGLEVPHHKGLQGHSDSDALVHAICDALLGAMGEGDLGRHYPSSDQRFKNISSLKLLEDVVKELDGDVQPVKPKVVDYIKKNQSLITESVVAEDLAYFHDIANAGE